jgi:sortase (surface protein transpeptidase)
VQSTLIRLGLNADGTVQVPMSFHVAGWYEHSVTPGQTGPSVILGHVDSKGGPGIFFRLGALHPSDRVVVKRADGTAATFEITAVRSYFKQRFPTLDVYGNTPTPTIRLITCGGTFDRATGHYLSNIVAFGQLVTGP